MQHATVFAASQSNNASVVEQTFVQASPKRKFEGWEPSAWDATIEAGIHRSQAMPSDTPPLPSVHARATDALTLSTHPSFPVTTTSSNPPISPSVSATSAPPATATTFKPSFQFVVNEDAKQARKTVRKHVMREYRRRERWEHGDNNSSPVLSIPLSRKRDSTGGAGGAKKSSAASNGTRAGKGRTKKASNSSTATMKAESVSSDSASPTPILPTTPGGSSWLVAKEDTGEIQFEASKSKEGDAQLVRVKKGPVKRRRLDESPLHIDFERQRYGVPGHSSLGRIVPLDEVDLNLEDDNGGDDTESLLNPLNNTTNTALGYGADPWAAVAPSHVDPFSQKLNFDDSDDTKSLMHHFAWTMPSIMDERVTGTNFHRVGWLFSCVAVHDPTPLYVILGFTLAHIAQCHGVKEPPIAIEHKNKALQLITERMNHPVEAVSNGLIGAVVNIAGYELVGSNAQGFATHMTGLSRIITSRGGMCSLQGNQELEDVILRLDVVRAYIALSAPRYPTYSVLRNLSPIAINIPRDVLPFDPIEFAAEERKVVYRFCEDCIYLVHELEDFMMLAGSAARSLQAGAQDKESAEETETTRQLISAAATQLLCRQDLGNAAGSPLSRKCCRLAVLVFMDLAVRELFDTPGRCGQFIHVLKSRLLGPMTPWGRSLEMLLHVLVKHERLALEKAWRAWYVADMITMTMSLSEETWIIAEARMMAYVREEAATAGLALSSSMPLSSSSSPPPAGRRSASVWSLRDTLDAFLGAWG